MSNTFLEVHDGLTLKQLSSYVGSDNVGQVLNVNGLKRQRNISGQVEEKYSQAVSSNELVSWKRKAEILNTLSTDSDAFEMAAVQDDNGWKYLSGNMTFPGYLSIPNTVEIVKYDGVVGNGTPVSKDVYSKVIGSLERMGKLSTSLFNDFSTIKPVAKYAQSSSVSGSSAALFSLFKIPWGDVTFYSSLSDSSVDIPAYPEAIKDPRQASYSSMPDTMYQYEPWYTYSSSGPRELSVSFHLHRQMWTGDERDGLANKMIKFIQASTFPRYSGSNVNTDTCTLYIKGNPYITGIVTSAEVEWMGPIGLDGFYLEFNLSVTFVEVSARALNYDVVKNLPIMGK